MNRREFMAGMAAGAALPIFAAGEACAAGGQPTIKPTRFKPIEIPGLAPRPGHRIRATVGPLWAPEADGPGGGHDRGWLGTARWDFPVWHAADGTPALLGHLFAELLLPGSYYDTDDLAYFLRWELSLAF